MWRIAGPSDWGEGDDAGNEANFRLEEATFVAPAAAEPVPVPDDAEKKKKKRKRRRKHKGEREATDGAPEAEEGVEEPAEPAPTKPEKHKASKQSVEVAQAEGGAEKRRPKQEKIDRKRHRAEEAPTAAPKSAAVAPRGPVPAAATVSAPKLTALQEKLKKKLEGGHFRYLNEQLYTTTGEEALKLFTDQPELFDVYHKGFRSQVEEWPVNPIDVFIARLKAMPQRLVVADFGCGEAKLAQSVKQKVHSFDLNPVNEYVTVCDVANVPLSDGTVDVGVFSLSLMGTNYQDFILEARRVLKPNGRLWIAEVKSRFDGNDLKGFIKALRSLGFDLKEEETSNKMFVILDLVRSSREPVKTSYALKPCIYKRR